MRPCLFRCTVALAACLPFAAAVQAQAMGQGQKPGLWETKTTIRNAQMDEEMAKMQREMASMPPEQRQMMENMMAGQGVGISGNAMTSRMCISREQAAAGSVPQAQAADHCQ